MASVEALLPRYVRPLPRYTSYPTAPIWSDDFSEARHREALRKIQSDVSVYVHVPFCRALCHFCACNRIVTHDPELPRRYLSTLEREIRAVRSELPAGIGAAQVHLGGGTPTHLEPQQLIRLMNAIRSSFPIRPRAEVSIEVDPRVTTPAHVEAMSRCGFNRVSLGVQDFAPKVQEAIHRVQSVEMTLHLVSALRAGGVSSVAFDLIYGLPFQTPSSLSQTLDDVLAIGPDRIALYSYAHVTWIAKQQRGFERHDLPSASEKLALFLLALERMEEAGYVHIGLDHFAKPSDELSGAKADESLHRNFMGYTTRKGLDLVGLGPSAISELRGCYVQNHRGLEEWEAAIDSQHLATHRGHVLDEADNERRFVIGKILCHGAVIASEFTERFAHRFSNRFSDELLRLGAMEEDGLLEIAADGSFTLSAAGRLLARNVASVFDSYLEGDPPADSPRFSQSV